MVELCFCSPTPWTKTTPTRRWVRGSDADAATGGVIVFVAFMASRSVSARATGQFYGRATAVVKRWASRARSTRERVGQD
jgi:hypothetical protein